MILPFIPDKDSELKRIVAFYEKGDYTHCIYSCRYFLEKLSADSEEHVKAYLYLVKAFIKTDNAGPALEALKRIFVITRRNIEAYDLALGILKSPFENESYKYYEHDAISLIRRLSDDTPDRDAAIALLDKIMDVYVDANEEYDDEPIIEAIDPHAMLERYIHDAQITALQYGVDAAIDDFMKLQPKYGNTARYNYALSAFHMMNNDWTHALEVIDYGLAYAPDDIGLLISAVTCREQLELDSSEAILKIAAYNYTDSATLIDALKAVYESGEYDMAIEMIDRSGFSLNMRLLFIKACACYNIGDTESARSIFKLMNNLFRESSPAYDCYDSAAGKILPPLKGDFTSVDAFQIHKRLIKTAESFISAYHRADDGSIDELTNEMKVALRASGSECIDGRAIANIVRDKFSDEVFVGNECFFADLLYKNDIAPGVRASIWFRLQSVFTGKIYYGAYGSYVYPIKVDINDSILESDETIKSAYFYAAAVAAFHSKYDSYAYSNALERLLNTELYDNADVDDYKPLAALLMKIAYTPFFTLDESVIAELFDTKASRIVKLRRTFNKHRNLYDKQEMEEYVYLRHGGVNDGSGVTV